MYLATNFSSSPALRRGLVILTFGAVLFGCKPSAQDCGEGAQEIKSMQPSSPEGIDGIEATTTQEGQGEVITSGDIASMHYTGWLFDPEAADGRGAKFDSSHDRNQAFEFELGAGRVIRGWDVGVEGMRIGETRELKISPDLGYGARGAGGVIPPNATLIFEVQLVKFKRCKEYS